MKRSLLHIFTALLTFVVGSILPAFWATPVFEVREVKEVKAQGLYPIYFKCPGFVIIDEPSYRDGHVPKLMEFAAPLPPAPQTHLLPLNKAELRKRVRE